MIMEWVFLLIYKTQVQQADFFQVENTAGVENLLLLTVEFKLFKIA